MPEIKFLQSQINDLNIKNSATERIAMEATRISTVNQEAIKAMHQRMDKVATKDDFQKMLDASNNKFVADLAKKIGWSVLTLGLGGLFSWFMGYIK